MAGSEQLTIRSSLRRVIGLDADFRVAPEHEVHVRFTGNVAQRDGSIPVTAVDISDGGVGVLATTYIPRRCLGQLTIHDPRDANKALFTSLVRVARSQMVDRRPGYQLGLLFEEPGPEFEQRLLAFLRLVDEVM